MSLKRIQQLERQVRELQAEVMQLRNQRQNQTGLIQPVIFKLNADLAAASAITGGYSCPAARHPMWDLDAVTFTSSTPNATTMQAVVAGSTARTGVLVNIWQEILGSGNFVLAIPYKNAYLPATELCPAE